MGHTRRRRRTCAASVQIHANIVLSAVCGGRTGVGVRRRSNQEPLNSKCAHALTDRVTSSCLSHVGIKQTVPFVSSVVEVCDDHANALERRVFAFAKSITNIGGCSRAWMFADRATRLPGSHRAHQILTAVTSLSQLPTATTTRTRRRVARIHVESVGHTAVIGLVSEQRQCVRHSIR
jgi:hypothetical protein